MVQTTLWQEFSAIAEKQAAECHGEMIFGTLKDQHGSRGQRCLTENRLQEEVCEAIPFSLASTKKLLFCIRKECMNWKN